MIRKQFPELYYFAPTIIVGKRDSYYYAMKYGDKYPFVKSSDALTVIEEARDSLTTGRIFLCDGTYELSDTLVIKKAEIVGESREGTILYYNGTSYAVRTELDLFTIKNLTIKIGTSALGCLYVKPYVDVGLIENVKFLGEDETVSGQYGIRFDAGDGSCYYHRVVKCLFYFLNVGIKTETSGTGRANAQRIIDPFFYRIGSVGIDFSPDGSDEHTVLGGFWASSPNAVGFKSDGWRNYFIGCQLEMGTGSKAFELLSNSSQNIVLVNSNCPTAPTIEGSDHLVWYRGRFEHENHGTATITGDGSTTTFTVDIEHGLASDKVACKVTLDRDGTIDKVYLVDTDSDGFYETIRVEVTYATAPASDETVPIYWSAQVVE